MTRLYRRCMLGGAGLMATAFLWALSPTALGQGISGMSSGGFGGGSSGFGGGGGLGGGTGLSGGGGFSGGGGSGFSGGSGSGFSGGTGSTFSGGGSTFSGGGSTFSGGTGGFTGTTGGGAYGSGGIAGALGGSTGVSSTNAFSSYFVNPLALGLGTQVQQSGVANSPVAAFGSPIYGNLTTSTTGTISGGGSMLGGSGGISGMGGMSGLGGTGMRGSTSTTMPFTLVLQSSSSAAPPATFAPRNSALERTVVDVLARSTALPSRQRLLVAVQGQNVILAGTVSDEHERGLAEALIRLTPGVQDVINRVRIGTGPPVR